MNPGVKSVKALADYKLLLVFDNGERRIFDMMPWLTRGAFRELQDDGMFRTVRVSFDTVEWSKGCDLCPEVLYAESDTVESALPMRPPAGKAVAVAEGRVQYKTARGKGIARRQLGLKMT
jgi:hypothetical protein